MGKKKKCVLRFCVGFSTNFRNQCTEIQFQILDFKSKIIKKFDLGLREHELREMDRF